MQVNIHNKHYDQQRNAEKGKTDARELEVTPEYTEEKRDKEVDDFFTNEYKNGDNQKQEYQGHKGHQGRQDFHGYQGSKGRYNDDFNQKNFNNFYQTPGDQVPSQFSQGRVPYDNFKPNNSGFDNQNSYNNSSSYNDFRGERGGYRKEPFTSHYNPEFKKRDMFDIMINPKFQDRNQDRTQETSQPMNDIPDQVKEPNNYSCYSSYGNKYFNRFEQPNSNTDNNFNSYNNRGTTSYRPRGSWRGGDRGDRGDRGYRGYRSRGFRGDRGDHGDREDKGDREIEEVYDHSDWQQKFKEADDFFNNEFQYKDSNKLDFNRGSGFDHERQGQGSGQTHGFGEISAYSVNIDYNQDSAYNKFGGRQNYNNRGNYNTHRDNFRHNNEDNEDDDDDLEKPFNKNYSRGRGFSRPFNRSGHRGDYQYRGFQENRRGNY